MEIWKDIKGYEGLYQVSNLGRVKSLEKTIYCQKRSNFKVKEKILKLGTHKRGYKTIMLHKNNLVKLCLVHRLVAKAFIPNPENLPQVNHKDENKENNCVDNLEWCTNEYNSYYGTRLQRSAEHQPRKQIAQYDINGNFIRIWNSIAEAERTLKINNICKVCKGEYKQTKGYIFNYIEKKDE